MIYMLAPMQPRYPPPIYVANMANMMQQQQLQQLQYNGASRMGNGDNYMHMEQQDVELHYKQNVPYLKYTSTHRTVYAQAALPKEPKKEHSKMPQQAPNPYRVPSTTPKVEVIAAPASKKGKKLKYSRCKDFFLNGVCKNGTECEFAHCLTELKDSQQRQAKCMKDILRRRKLATATQPLPSQGKTAENPRRPKPPQVEPVEPPYHPEPSQAAPIKCPFHPESVDTETEVAEDVSASASSHSDIGRNDPYEPIKVPENPRLMQPITSSIVNGDLGIFFTSLRYDV